MMDVGARFIRSFGFDASDLLSLEQCDEFFEPETVEPDPQAISEGGIKVVYDEDLSLGPYDVLMTKVDVSLGEWGQNVFYKMQVLHQTVRDVYILFTRWGRIGDVGQYQQTPFPSREETVKQFKKIFKEKSGNEWQNKAKFEKKPSKYLLLKKQRKTQMKDSLINFNLESDKLIPSSQLDARTFRFMKKFCTVEQFRNRIKRFTQVDFDYLNLNALSKEKIFECIRILQSINSNLQQIKLNMGNLLQNNIKLTQELSEKVAEKSSEFYALIPHKNFRNKAIVPINAQTIQPTIQLIMDLLDLELINKMLLAAQFNLYKINPMDYCFYALNVRMMLVHPDNQEYALIKKYAEQSGVDLLDSDVYALERKGEAERIKQCFALPNRMILWTQVEPDKLVGALYNGLLCDEAAQSSLGIKNKGVKFSDAAIEVFQRNKYTLLCEVALGNMQTRYDSGQSLIELEGGYQSQKVVGKCYPNPKHNIILCNGAAVPQGQLLQRADEEPNAQFFCQSTYNQYFVFDANQIRIRYLITDKDA